MSLTSTACHSTLGRANKAQDWNGGCARELHSNALTCDKELVSVGERGKETIYLASVRLLTLFCNLHWLNIMFFEADIYANVNEL